MFTLRVTWLAVSMATGMPMAVSATCAIIAPVQTRPKRSVAPPVPRFARCGCTRARVTFSAGRKDNIAAQTTARPLAYTIVVSDKPGVNQNGASPTLSIPHLNARSAAIRPTAAATDASTRASTKSWLMIRSRLAPSAKRTAISPSRVAVLA